MLYRVYITDVGKFREPEEYEFVAEFAEEKLAGYYMRYMRGKAKYRRKDIIIKEVPDTDKDPREGKAQIACAVSGEYLRPEEWNF